jgi:hypothetical protein
MQTSLLLATKSFVVVADSPCNTRDLIEAPPGCHINLNGVSYVTFEQLNQQPHAFRVQSCYLGLIRGFVLFPHQRRVMHVRKGRPLHQYDAIGSADSPSQLSNCDGLTIPTRVTADHC